MIQSSNVLERAMALAMSRACVDFSPPPSITPSPTGFTSPKFPKETFFKRAIKRALVVTSFSFENQTSNSGSRLISIIITLSVFVIIVSYRIHLGDAFPAPLNGYKSFTTMNGFCDCAQNDNRFTLMAIVVLYNLVQYNSVRYCHPRASHGKIL